MLQNVTNQCKFVNVFLGMLFCSNKSPCRFSNSEIQFSVFYFGFGFRASVHHSLSFSANDQIDISLAAPGGPSSGEVKFCLVPTRSLPRAVGFSLQQAALRISDPQTGEVKLCLMPTRGNPEAVGFPLPQAALRIYSPATRH